MDDNDPRRKVAIQKHITLLNQKPKSIDVREQCLKILKQKPIDPTIKIDPKLRARLELLRKRIKKSHEEITKLQNECPHPKELVTKKYGGNTGNYDPTSDCYWTEFTCTNCDYKWTKYEDAH